MKGAPGTWWSVVLATLLFPPLVSAQAPWYEVYAVQYATIPSFRVASLVAGADTARRLDIAMMVWVLRGEGRVVLVDAGFYREKFLERWKPAGFVRPDSAVARLGIPPGEVTDIIVTHVHWDHLDGADLFPNARVWLQREEFAHHVDQAGQPRNRTIDPDDAAMLHRLGSAGRLMLIDGDGQQALPGIMVYTGGKHTYASQYAAVRTREGAVVLASDNLYLYENLERGVPVAQTLDPVANLEAQRRMRALASLTRLIVPGHDPAVLERFERVLPGVVRVR